jgi:hypothetical protein
VLHRDWKASDLEDYQCAAECDGSERRPPESGRVLVDQREYAHHARQDEGQGDPVGTALALRIVLPLFDAQLHGDKPEAQKSETHRRERLVEIVKLHGRIKLHYSPSNRHRSQRRGLTQSGYIVTQE